MSDQDLAVIVKDLRKSFKLPHEKSSGLKQIALNIFNSDRGYEIQEVLKGVTFEIKKGEFFGIVGRNGSGKSTLLKLLAGIYNPDQGSLEVRGSLTPFIELGVGFNPELTGRENVFLNGALLGFSRKEIEEIYDDIVEFAELERFMDQKLKNYSSGMQVRLAFSIAIQAESDILLVDEVLAVGDANFQEKCLEVFKKLKKEKKTIIFISHDMGMIRRFCDRVIMIKEGEILVEGTAKKVAEYYEAENIPETQTTEGIGSKIQELDNKIITKMQVKNSKGKDTNIFNPGNTVTLHLNTIGHEHAKNAGIAIYGADNGYVYGTNTIIDSFPIDLRDFQYTVKVPEGSGQYYFKIGIFGETDDEVLEFYDNGPAFQVVGENEWGGTTPLKHEWSNKKMK